MKELEKTKDDFIERLISNPYTNELFTVTFSQTNKNQGEAIFKDNINGKIAKGLWTAFKNEDDVTIRLDEENGNTIFESNHFSFYNNLDSRVTIFPKHFTS